MPGLTIANAGFLGSSSQQLQLATYVGGYTISLGSTLSSYNVVLTSLSGGANFAPSIGDLVFIAAGNPSIDVDHSISVTGYTTIGEYYLNNTRDVNLFLGYKVLSSTDTELTVNNTVSGTMASSYAVHVWRGASTTNTINVTLNTVGTSGGNANPPALSTPVNDALVLAAGLLAHNAGVRTYTSSDLSNFISSGAEGSSGDSTIGLGSTFVTLATTNPAAFTLSGTSGTAPFYIAATLVLTIS